MGQAFTPPSRDFLRELQVLRREVDALKRMPSGAASISTGYLAPVPACRVYRDSAQTISASTSTALEYNQEYVDGWGMHDTSSNSWRLVAPIAGWYMVGAVTGLAASTTGSFRQLYLQKNLDSGFAGRKWAESSSPPGSAPTRLSVSTVVQLAVGDWMSVVVYHNATGSLLTENLTHVRDEAWMCWLGN